MPKSSDHDEVSRFYTASRRIPTMIGRLPDGSRIWGGPYTVSQVVIGLIVMVVALMTRPLWSIGGLLDLVAILGTGYGACYLARYIPQSKFNLFVVGSVAARAFISPVQGRLKGRRFQWPKPNQVQCSRVLVFRTSSPSAIRSEVLAEVEKPAVTEPVPAQVSDSVPVVGPSTVMAVNPIVPSSPALQRLIDQANARKHLVRK